MNRKLESIPLKWGIVSLLPVIQNLYAFGLTRQTEITSPFLIYIKAGNDPVGHLAKYQRSVFPYSVVEDERQAKWPNKRVITQKVLRKTLRLFRCARFSFIIQGGMSTTTSKRKASPSPTGSTANGTLITTKRPRPSSPASNTQQIAISSTGPNDSKALLRTVPRTSGLEAPIVSLAGAHTMEILSCRFDPTGANIAACSADRSISLWKTYPPTTNYGHLISLHKAPITDLQWSLAYPLLYTVSADKTLIYTDTTTGERARKHRAHTGVINGLDRTLAGGGGRELLATGSDDGTVKVWEGGDEGSKNCVASFQVGCPVTAVCWGGEGGVVYAGAVDNEIHVFDLRTQTQQATLLGHVDTPTSLSLSPSGHYLLSPSLSSATIIHDVRPFSPAPNRIHRILQGAPAGFENTLLRGAWSKDDGGQRVAVGGADRTVTIWEVENGKVLYKLPGHKGTVTSVDFHPKEPIVLTGSKDSTMLLGELEFGTRV